MADEQGLNEQREAYAAIFDAASDAIVSVDAAGRILLFNPGAERMFAPARSVEMLKCTSQLSQKLHETVSHPDDPLE